MEHFGMNIWNSRYQRDRVIDILKGIGIFLMVFRHARAPFSEFVLLFHMALFFIASGYLYKKEKCNSINNLVIYIKAKLRHLWMPYCIASSCFILLNNFFLKINIYTDNELFLNHEGKYVVLGEWYDAGRIIRELIKAILFFGSTQMGGALWFFRTLFGVIVGYGIIDFCIVQLGFEKQRNLIQFSVSWVSLLIGWYLSVNGIDSRMGSIFSVYSLIFTGNIIKEKSIMELFSSRSKKNSRSSFFTCCFNSWFFYWIYISG